MAELQVLLGLNCNFKCSHCLNDSFPGRRDTELSYDEIRELASSVNLTEEIQIISFSGGEPLLYLEKIEAMISLIRKTRPDVKFSITTNGSMIEKNKDVLKALKIDYCLISFDKEHEDFFGAKDFEEMLSVAKDIFPTIELNVTYENEPQLSSLKEFLLKENIKVNFNKKVISGRNYKANGKEHLINSNLKNFTNIICPNLSTHQNKLTYITKKGFSVCCGPVVFDNLTDPKNLFFENLEKINDNLMQKLLGKFQTTKLNLAKDLACHMCASIFKKFNDSELRMFLNTNPWDNLLTEWQEEKLDTYNELFNPKYVKKVEIKSFDNYLSNRNLPPSSKLKSFYGNKLSSEGIEAFSNFTIDSFYKIHNKYYSDSDILRFKKDQSVFFSLPYKYIYHTYEDKIVAYFTACEIETHPFFKEKTWHIGYWGISSALRKNDRDLIKRSWGSMLEELNTKAAIGANIDYFNVAANTMSEKFNFKSLGLRLDARQ